MIKVYGRANSINVRKVLWMLDEVGEAYSRTDWGRGYRPTSEPEFVAVSPFGVVPVVDDDGFVLRESNTIVRYLATKHGRTDLYPSTLRERALCESWMDWANTDLYLGVRPVFMGLVVKSPAFSDPKMIAAGADDWNDQMRRLDAHLAAAGPYLMGANFTIADIPAGLVVNRWASIDFAKPELKNVMAYYDRLATRPAFRTHGRNGTP
ncbi:MAG TPA: glutathione S-transferase family protein [Hyphomicrobiaceae bacterium]|mgnify:CR=1 FL=1|nr:glutathione S-transferase family protein [Hyphomicrobiaceae bacterium]